MFYKSFLHIFLKKVFFHDIYECYTIRWIQLTDAYIIKKQCELNLYQKCFDLVYMILEI